MSPRLKQYQIGALLMLAASGFLAICPDAIYAEAFRILDQGASAAAQGGAFAAQADDPSALHYNPAGMTQLRGVQFSVGTNLIGGSVSFQSPTGATTRGDFGGSVAIPPPSNAYLVANLKDLGIEAFGNLSLGLGITSPFGIKTRYPNEAPFSTAVTSASLPLFDIKPTIAYKLNDQLSVGVGADIYTFAGFLGSGQLEIKNNWPGGGGIPAGTPVELNGKDTAAGFNVSLLYTPYRNDEGKPLVNIGLVYRSQATLHLNGEFLVNGAVASNSSATLVLPQVLTGAFAVWPLRDQRREWKLEMDVDYAGWKSNRNLDVRLSNGGLLPFPQNWRSSYVIMLGTEYKWLKPNSLPEWNIAARAGYWRSQTGIPDQTFNPAVPDSDNHAVSVGLGLLCQNNGKFLGLFECGGQGMGNFRTKAIGLDLAYQAVLYETRTISGNINPTVNGTYRTTLHVGAVNLRVDF